MKPLQVSVRNMESPRSGHPVPNQFIIETCDGTYFQSYRMVIAARIDGKWYLDHNWDYSRTTGKYRNSFLNETRRETEAKIKSGFYVVTNLNI